MDYSAVKEVLVKSNFYSAPVSNVYPDQPAWGVGKEFLDGY